MATNLAPPFYPAKDMERLKFYDNGDGTFSVFVRGTFIATPSGLNVAGKITEVALNDSTWTALPLTAQTDRNTFGIQNTSGVELKLNFDNTQVGYVGWKVPDGGEFFVDARNGIQIYAKASSGTPTVVVMELA